MFSGLDALHELTSSKSYQLRVDISDWAGLTAHVLHASITVADETDFYRLALGEILDGEAGIKHRGMKKNYYSFPGLVVLNSCSFWLK